MDDHEILKQRIERATPAYEYALKTAGGTGSESTARSHDIELIERHQALMSADELKTFEWTKKMFESGKRRYNEDKEWTEPAAVMHRRELAEALAIGGR